MKNFRMAVKKVLIKKNEIILFFLFVLFLIGSIAFSPTPILGIYFLLKIIEFTLLGFILYVNKNQITKFILITFPFAIIFESVLAILEFINRGSLNGVFYFFGERSFNSQTPDIANAIINGALVLRPYATFSHPNTLGGFLLISMTIVILNIKNQKKFLKYFYYLSLIIGTVALLLTLSRTAISVYIIFLVIYIFRSFKISKSKNLLPSLLLSIIGASFLVTSLNLRFVSLFSDTAFMDRKLLIDATIKMIGKNPLFGVGLNNFLPALPNFYSSRQNVFYIQPVHNIPLLIIAEIGIPASLILFYFLIKLFYKTNFFGKMLLFEALLVSMFDHYFLTVQQGQILLTLVVTLSIIYASFNDKIKGNA